MSSITFLGPQRPDPNVRAAIDALGIAGPLAVISAGWRDSEGELEDLATAVQLPIVGLKLYERVEQLFAEDVALFRAHRERQNRLKELQRYYRIRLRCAMNAAFELLETDTESSVLQSQRRAAISQVRSIDRQHVTEIRRIHKQFQEEWAPAQRPSVSRHIDELRALTEGTEAVLIAGGHVGVLLSRMRLFGLERLIEGRPIIAWSAGAMVLTERIVLFHDRAPQGRREPEIFDLGLALNRRLVALPHARRRLDLDDKGHLRLFARRFAPAACVTLDNGASLRWQEEQLVDRAGGLRIGADGRLRSVRMS